MKTSPLRLISSLATAIFASSLLLNPQNASAEIAVKSGEKIAFLGDSITAGGWGNPAGYVRLVMAGLEANGVKAEAIPAGVSGHKSDQMLARLEKDVLQKKPQWMTLSCGVNDVWHGKKGVPLDDSEAAAKALGIEGPADPARGTYKKNITQIVEKATAAGAKVMVLTATVIKEDPSTPENAKLAPYNAFLRQLAAEKHLALADLNAAFQERLKSENKPTQKVLTVDGVHMNTAGNELMATVILKTFGLDQAQLTKARESWKPLEEKAEAEAAKKAAEAKAKAADAKAKADAEKAKAPGAAPAVPAAPVGK